MRFSIVGFNNILTLTYYEKNNHIIDGITFSLFLQEE